MGGRGASIGISIAGNTYGTQYRTVLEKDEIKFVEKVSRGSEALMETMTQGRIYVHVGGDDLLRIVLFSEDNKRNRVIEYEKRTKTWHVHVGYLHSENSEEAHEKLKEKDVRLVEKVIKLWNNRKANQKVV